MEINILIVDDEQIVCEGMMNRIARIGPGGVARTECRLSGAEALELARSCPDAAWLVFVDINMPGMDGLELIRLLREAAPMAGFVVLTAHREFSYAQEALRLGADDYLLKPVLFEQFKKTLESSLEKLKARLGAVGRAGRPAKSPLSEALDTLVYGGPPELGQILRADPALGGWESYAVALFGPAPGAGQNSVPAGAALAGPEGGAPAGRSGAYSERDGALAAQGEALAGTGEALAMRNGAPAAQGEAFSGLGGALAGPEGEYAALPFQLGRGLLVGLGPQATPKSAISHILGDIRANGGMGPFLAGACGVSAAGASLPELYAEAAQMLEVSRFYPKMGPVFAEGARQAAGGPQAGCSSQAVGPQAGALPQTAGAGHPPALPPFAPPPSGSRPSAPPFAKPPLAPRHSIPDEDRRAQAKALRTFDREGYQRLVMKLFPDILPDPRHFSETGRLYIGALRVLDSVAFSFSLDAGRLPGEIEAFSDVGELRGALLGAFDALAGAFAEKLGRFTLEDSLRYISENLDSVDLATVANYMDLSYTYFSQLFKKSTGQSFTKYISSMKMKSALKLLGSGKKIAAAASMLGYVSPKNFARAFKSYYGVAPSRWRSLRPESKVKMKAE
ncbi:MAG: response regulator [Clostridiales bacterium]|nr:response regulator [Clostridiales bacterium]